MQPETAEQLARIETEIAAHRNLYLRAIWAGHDGEAEAHERCVDELLGDWDELRRAEVRKAEHA